MTVISDSCFSGTVLRAAIGENIPGMRTPDDRRVRFLNPVLRGLHANPKIFKAIPNSRLKYPESSMKALLLSGANDNEYSYDAFIDGLYRGAMSYYALQAILSANYKLTYNQLHRRLISLIEDNYPQHPQLEGKDEHKKRQIFT